MEEDILQGDSQILEDWKEEILLSGRDMEMDTEGKDKEKVFGTKMKMMSLMIESRQQQSFCHDS
jgi:hypothetical protein